MAAALLGTLSLVLCPLKKDHESCYHTVLFSGDGQGSAVWMQGWTFHFTEDLWSSQQCGYLSLTAH